MIGPTNSRYKTKQRRRLGLFALLFLALALTIFIPSLRTAQSAGESGSFWKLPNPNFSQGKFSRTARPINIDARVNGQSRALTKSGMSPNALKTRAQSQGESIRKGLVRLKASVPTLDAHISSLTGAVEVLRSAKSLTGPNRDRAGAEIVRDFISTNRAIYGLNQQDIDHLNFIGESVNRRSGLRMVRVEQVVNGLPVFQSETRFILDSDGRVIRSTGLVIPAASDHAPSLEGLISAQAALRSAMATVEISADVGQMTAKETNADGTRTTVIANSSKILGDVPSKLVYFPLAPGLLVPAWSQITFTNAGFDWYTLVDATNGDLLWRKNIRNDASTHQARFSVYVQADGKTPADSPAPQSPSGAVAGAGTQFGEITRTTVTMSAVQDIAASANGWIDDCPGGGCATNETQTIGNNVHAYLDRFSDNVPDTNAQGVIDGNGKPIGNTDSFGRNRDFLGTTTRDFTMLPPPQGGAANAEVGQTATGNGNNGTNVFDAFRRGAITQLFYVCNWYHDQLFQLGFDEAAGNFQNTNFTGMGTGGDRVLAEAQDGGSVDNANFATPPDGTSGRAQMYRFTGPTIDRDGDLDTEILIHELTHGLSNRLIGNASGLIWDPGAAMGEGWSDFYALSLLNNTLADDPDAEYASGAYATYKLAGLAFLDNYVYGIRRFPYSTDNSVNPLTWADVDETTADMSGGIAVSPLGFELAGAMEVHNAGEVWALSLWEARSRVIAANAGNVPVGNNKMLEIVTDALKMTPDNPTFTEARDALVDADCAANSCANEQSIWDGFADRGLGYNASAPIAYGFGSDSMHMGVATSFVAPYLDVNTTTIDDSVTGNNNGRIDPGETVRLTVNLKNPWRNSLKNVASATATLTTSTAGIIIEDGNSTYPAIAAQGNASGDTFQFRVGTLATCGQSINLTITPSSTIGSQPVSFVLRVGSVSGTGAAVTYTRSALGLAIPDNDLTGVTDTLTITDDREISDINFRVDSLTHNTTGQLSVMLKGPTGYGIDLISLIGAAVGGGGTGNDLTNMVIDDTATGDILLATNGQAPYSSSWKPIFNSPTWASAVGFGPGDPVGELSRFNGTGTQGVWQVLVADDAPGTTGTLQGWSLIITPKTFA